LGALLGRLDFANEFAVTDELDEGHGSATALKNSRSSTLPWRSLMPCHTWTPLRP
jgi:hypothetical protein